MNSMVELLMSLMNVLLEGIGFLIVVFQSPPMSLLKEYVTLPPEMSHIDTCSLCGYSHFPKGGCQYIFFGFLPQSVSPVFFTSEK